MTERELIVPLRQERELQRRVKELEEALRELLLRIDEQATYGDEIRDAIRQAESLLSNSGAPNKESK